MFESIFSIIYRRWSIFKTKEKKKLKNIYISDFKKIIKMHM